MGKDPAVLWYWNDWQGGTSTFTRHLKGCYMDLLNAQFNNGRLSLTQIKTVLGQDYPEWGVLQEKFKKDGNDRYYNERAEFEKEKRVKYSESRKNNLKNSHMGSHMESHMENANGNKNRIENEIRGKGTGKGVYDAEAEVLKNPIRFEQIAMNCGKTIEQAKQALHAYHLYQIETDKYPKTKPGVFAGFERWLSNEKDKNGTHKQHSSGGGKKGTSEARIDRAREW